MRPGDSSTGHHRATEIKSLPQLAVKVKSTAAVTGSFSRVQHPAAEAPGQQLPPDDSKKFSGLIVEAS